MLQFDNVSVIKSANIYFDGKVSSRTVLFKDGTRKTLGLMLPGEYEFGTNEKEVMEILTGELEVCLPNESWKTIVAGQSFEIAAHAKFQLKIKQVVDYCCSYISA